MIVRNYAQTLPGPPRSAAPLTPRSLAETFWRHKKKMAALSCATLALCVAALALYPRSYVSESRLFIRLGKESVALDPTATVNQVITVNESRESEINSELDILRSRVLLEDVVERLGPEAVIRPAPKNSWRAKVMATVRWVKKSLTGEEVSAKEAAVNSLEKAITVSSGRRTSVLVVVCKAGDPRQAQQVLEAYVASYLSRHSTAHRTSGSYDFFATQSRLLQAQWTTAQKQLRDAKSQHGMASVEGHRANVERQHNAVETARLENERALAANRDKIQELKRQVDRLPEHELAEESTIANAAADSMRSDLYKVQIEEHDLRSRFTNAHPQVIARKLQVTEMQKILSAAEGDRSQPTRKLNSVRQVMLAELATAETDAAQLKAEATSLARQSDAIQSRIQAVNETELQVNELTHQCELLQASYRNYATNCEQARINDALEDGSISNVNVLQEPTHRAKAAGPSLLMMLGLAGMLAVLAPVVLTLLLATFSTTAAEATPPLQQLHDTVVDVRRFPRTNRRGRRAGSSSAQRAS